MTVNVSFEFIKLIKFEVVLILMVLNFLHQIRLNLKLLSSKLRLQDRNFLILSSHLLLNIASKSTHCYFNLLDSSAPTDYLGESITHFPLNSELVIPNLVVTSNHLLSPLDYLILKDFKSLLKRI